MSEESYKTREDGRVNALLCVDKGDDIRVDDAVMLCSYNTIVGFARVEKVGQRFGSVWREDMSCHRAILRIVPTNWLPELPTESYSVFVDELFKVAETIWGDDIEESISEELVGARVHNREIAVKIVCEAYALATAKAKD